MMRTYTVAECKRAADYELEAASASLDRHDRIFHLNRASVFAHCCEEGTRAGKAANCTDMTIVLCKPKFAAGYDEFELRSLREAIMFALVLADEQGESLVATYLDQTLAALDSRSFVS